MELNKYVLDNATKINVCQEYAKLIPLAKSADDLMKMYVSPKGVEFCLANDFPSNKDLVAKAGDIINQYGVYIDANIKLADRGFLVLLGACTGTVSYDGYSVNQLFVKHKTSIQITASHHSYTLIDCFDKSDLNIICEGNARVWVNVYGKAKVAASGGGTVKIVHKLKSSY